MEINNNNRATRILNLIARLENMLLVGFLSGMIGLAILQIILRNVFQSGYTDGDSMLRILVLWVGMFGAVVATRERKHIAIDVLTRYISERARTIVGLIVDIFVFVICAILTGYAVRMVMIDYADGGTAFSQVPIWMMELILPFAFGVITLRYCMFIVLRIGELINGTRP
ncbi:MAG: TRAP transporter small permease [Gammaproteobacteria bacterium]|nr:TRAP transporter small permease [Gammaproteobacteria bacterium]